MSLSFNMESCEKEYLWRIIEAKDKINRLLAGRLARSQSKALTDSKLTAMEDKLLKYYEESIQHLQSVIQGLNAAAHLRGPLMDLHLTSGSHAQEATAAPGQVRGREDSECDLVYGLKQMAKENELLKGQLRSERDRNVAHLVNAERQFEELLKAVVELGDYEGMVDRAINHQRHDLQLQLRAEEEKATRLETELVEVQNAHIQLQEDLASLRREKEQLLERHWHARVLDTFDIASSQDTKPKKEELDALLRPSESDTNGVDWERKYLANLVVSYRDFLSIVKTLEEAVRLSGESPSPQPGPLFSALQTAKCYLSQLESEVVDERVRQTLVTWRQSRPEIA